MNVRVGECGNVLWGYFVNYTENCWENQPNVQCKENHTSPHYMCKNLWCKSAASVGVKLITILINI